MPVSPGTHFGPYEVLGPLGAGGMGHVYRARDTRLDRVVALKIVSPELTHEGVRRHRFHREARAISSLSHPNICSLYDVGEQGDVSFLVMEYLDGETLAARLLRGRLPRDEVLLRAAEVAAALDHAHRHGIVHRDLKPSNVMLTTSGAKLMDFGLAKLRPTGTPVIADTETIPGTPTTVEGTILGTVQYMAPEQLEGREADVRTDVFAFGALVYEMATGEKAFSGGSQASVIAAILRADAPRITAFDPLAPPALDHVIARCLAKDPNERWQTARDVMLEVRDIQSGRSKESTFEDIHSARGRAHGGARWRREQLAWTLALVSTLVAIGVTVAFWRAQGAASTRAPDPLMSAAVRAEIPAPEDTTVSSIALSPDGRRLVFVGRRGLISRLWVRALDAVTAQPLAGTEGADYPFWSPDGASLAFFADGRLKRIDVTGGPVQTLAEAPNTRGGTWGTTGTILFSPSSQALFRVPATGGPLEAVTTLDVSRGELTHRWPQFLPDGQHFLYLAQGSVPENRGLFVASLDKSTKKFLVRTERSGAYVAPGYLLYLRESMLMAQRFRLDRLEVEGSPVSLAEPVSVNGLERAQFEIAANTLLYRRGTFIGSSEMIWVDRRGRRLGQIGTPSDFRAVRISPSGLHVALAIEDPRVGTPDVWTHDIARGVATRFSFDPGTDRDPVWSPDGERLAVRSNRNERFNVYVRALTGVGGEQLLYDSTQNANIHDWSRDGRSMLFTHVDPAGKTDRDIWILPAQERGAPSPFITAPLNQDYPRFSPSGRLVSYQSEDSGRNKIYVMPYPDSGDKWEISPDGGVQPIWRGDGRELFYVAPDNTIMAVDVREGPATVQFGTPRPLFQAAIAVLPARQPSWTWDVSPDGQRFLIIVAKDDPAPLTLVTNWRADLKQ